MWGRFAWVLAVAGGCAVIPSSTKDDGQYCASDADCDSKSCNAVHRCEGSDCKADRDCNDGWKCQEGEKQVIGRAPSQCVYTCAGCPAEWSCRDGHPGCRPNDIAVVIDRPAAGSVLRRGEKTRVHATTGPTIDATFFEWKVDGQFGATGNDAEITATQIGEVKLSVEVSSDAPGSAPRGKAEATFQVCEPQSGMICRQDAECCAPLKCVFDGFGGRGGCT